MTEASGSGMPGPNDPGRTRQGKAGSLIAGAILAALLAVCGAGAAQSQDLSSPTRLAFMSATRLLVSDSRRHAVFVIDSATLRSVASVPIPGDPLGVAWGAGRLFVGNETRGAVEVYAPHMTPPAKARSRDVRNARRHKRDDARPGRYKEKARRGDDRESREIRDRDDEDDPPDADEHDDTRGSAAAGSLRFEKRYDLGLGSGSVGSPADIAVDEGRQLVFVVDGITRNVKVFAVGGALLRTLPDVAAGAPALAQPTAIAIDPARSEVLVSDFGEPGAFGTEAWVRIYGYDGTYHAGISGNTVPGYRFSRPQGLAIDAAGHVLLVDSLLGQVLVFDRLTLQGLAKVGELGTARGQLLLPLDVALHPVDSTVYVTDNRNGRVGAFPRVGW